MVLSLVFKSTLPNAFIFNTKIYMKRYAANEELITILKKNGFVEISSKSDIINRKRRFNLLGFPKKELLFDNMLIVVYADGVEQDSKYTLSRVKVIMLVLFFKLRGSALKEFTQSLPFEYTKTQQRVALLNKEFCVSIVLDLKDPESKCARLIMNAYNAVKI